MKKGKIIRAGWFLVLVCGLLLIAGNLRADAESRIKELTDELEALKDAADDLLANVEATTDPAALMGYWGDALVLEEDALGYIQEGIDSCRAWDWGGEEPDYYSNELFVKTVIIFEHFHVKVVVTIDIIKMTIIRIRELIEMDPGFPEPVIPDIQMLMDELRDHLITADNLLAQVEAISDPGDIPALWDTLLDVEEDVANNAQDAIDYAQLYPEPSEYLMKILVIHEGFHVKVIGTITIAKLTIIQIIEEYWNPENPPWNPPWDQPVIDQVLAYTDQLKTLDVDAAALVDAVYAPPDDSFMLDMYWQEALALEEQALPILQDGIDAVLLSEYENFPTDLLIKKVIIFERWFLRFVINIRISKTLIIYWWEYYDYYPRIPDPGPIDFVDANTDQIRALDQQADDLIDEIRSTTLEHRHKMRYLFKSALGLEEIAISNMQDVIDTGQGIFESPELLRKGIIIFEKWSIRFVLEISICKCIIVRMREVFAGSSVNFTDFGAYSLANSVNVEWTTEAEIDNAGFNVHRGLTRAGPYEQLNTKLIPSKGNELGGADYAYVDDDVTKGVTYYYWLEDVDLYGNGAVHGPVFVTAGSEKRDETPAVFSLAQNYPNPFNPITEIKYDLPVSCRVKLDIYNVLGQRVGTLVDGYQDAGSKVALWNGRDEKGIEVSSGVYFYSLKAGNFNEIRKMVLLR